MATTNKSTATVDEQRNHEQEYQEHFDTEAYLNEYCHESSTYVRFVLEVLHSVFATEVTSGDSLLDFGSGPSIYATIAASNRFKNIVASDFVASNRDALCKWLRADPDCHDFSGMFKMAAALEKNTNYHELEDRVRKSVKAVIPCNAHLSNPIAPDERQFDVIVSCYALGSASPNQKSFRNVVANVSNILKPGGKLVLIGGLQGGFYHVGEHRFSGLFLTKEIVQQALDEAGLHPVKWILMPIPNEDSNCDTKTTFMTISTKPSK